MQRTLAAKRTSGLDGLQPIRILIVTLAGARRLRSDDSIRVRQDDKGFGNGKLQKLGDFDLTNEVVKSKMKEWYGDHVPLNEKMISPV